MAVNASQDLGAIFEVGQDSANLKGSFATGSGVNAVVQGVSVDVYVTKGIV